MPKPLDSKGGRSPKVLLTLTEESQKRLDGFCEAEKCTRSAGIRLLMDRGLAQPVAVALPKPPSTPSPLANASPLSKGLLSQLTKLTQVWGGHTVEMVVQRLVDAVLKHDYLPPELPKGPWQPKSAQPVPEDKPEPPPDTSWIVKEPKREPHHSDPAEPIDPAEEMRKWEEDLSRRANARDAAKLAAQRREPG